MKHFGKIEPSRKLNTKGCCFLCLQFENIIQTEEIEGSQLLQCVSIQQLLRHLQIPTVQSFDEKPIFGHCFKQGIQVDLCESCGHTISRFSVLFQKLEKIQLEMNYFLEKINKGISQSAKDSDLVQNYSKRMTSDLEGLSQLALVDNLRKQVAKGSLKKSNVPRFQLILTRAKFQPIKTDNFDMTYENNERYLSEDYSPDEVPPSSPNATENCDEDVKFSISSASTSEKEKGFSSLKPCAITEPFSTTNPKANTGKYYTRNPSTGLYKCNKCDKKSKSRNTITNHYRSVHLKIRYKCDICNTSNFSHLSWLTMHKKTCRENLEKAAANEQETKKFQFVCKECGKRFKTNTNLSNHRWRVHKNVDRFPCDLCDKKFKKKDQLRDHRDAVHLGKRLFCGSCSKPFSYKSDLRAHERKCAKKLSLKEEPLVKL